LIIHACFEANFRKNNFSAKFPSVSVFQCEASRRSPLESGWVLLRRPDSQVTRSDVRGSVECLCGISSGRVSDVSGQLSYRFKNRFLSLAAAPLFYFSQIFLTFFVFLVHFSCGFSRVHGLFCHLVHFISVPGILLHLLHYFQFYLTINLFNILKCILR